MQGCSIMPSDWRKGLMTVTDAPIGDAMSHVQAGSQHAVCCAVPGHLIRRKGDGPLTDWL
jgi:hypothetical protein